MFKLFDWIKKRTRQITGSNMFRLEDPGKPFEFSRDGEGKLDCDVGDLCNALLGETITLAELGASSLGELRDSLSNTSLNGGQALYADGLKYYYSTLEEVNDGFGATVAVAESAEVEAFTGRIDRLDRAGRLEEALALGGERFGLYKGRHTARKLEEYLRSAPVDKIYDNEIINKIAAENGLDRDNLDDAAEIYEKILESDIRHASMLSCNPSFEDSPGYVENLAAEPELAEKEPSLARKIGAGLVGIGMGIVGAFGLYSVADDDDDATSGLESIIVGAVDGSFDEKIGTTHSDFGNLTRNDASDDLTRAEPEIYTLIECDESVNANIKISEGKVFWGEDDGDMYYCSLEGGSRSHLANGNGLFDVDGDDFVYEDARSDTLRHINVKTGDEREINTPTYVRYPSVSDGKVAYTYSEDEYEWEGIGITFLNNDTAIKYPNKGYGALLCEDNLLYVEDTELKLHNIKSGSTKIVDSATVIYPSIITPKYIFYYKLMDIDSDGYTDTKVYVASSASTFEHIFEFEDEAGFPVSAIAGSTLARIVDNNILTIYDLQTKTKQQTISLDGDVAFGVAIGGDVVAYAEGCSIKLVDLDPDPEPENHNPIFTNLPSKLEAKVGEYFSFDVDAYDEDGDPLAYSDDAYWFDVNSGTGEFSWTPGAGDAGEHIVKFTASDGKGGTVSKYVTLSVAPADVEPDPDPDPTPEESYTIAFAADLHVKEDDINMGYDLGDYLNHIVTVYPEVDLILAGGDIVDWAGGDSGHANLQKAKDELEECDTDKKLVPGNHDAYNEGELYVFSDLPWYDEKSLKLSNNQFKDYNQFFEDAKYDGVDWVEPLGDRTVIIGMNTGGDIEATPGSWDWYSILGFDGPGTGYGPEGEGLYDAQMDGLEEALKDAESKGVDHIIILQHHPFNYKINGDLDANFEQNRGRFEELCDDYNVDLVLAGHTHKAQESIIGQNTRQIVTGALKDGNYRIITIGGADTRNTEDIQVSSGLIVEERTLITSAGDVALDKPAGDKVGYYIEDYGDLGCRVEITADPTQNYELKVVGISNGTYDLEINKNTGEHIFSAKDLPIREGEVNYFSLGADGVLALSYDWDGDGITDYGQSWDGDAMYASAKPAYGTGLEDVVDDSSINDAGNETSGGWNLPVSNTEATILVAGGALILFFSGMIVSEVTGNKTPKRGAEYIKHNAKNDMRGGYKEPRKELSEKRICGVYAWLHEPATQHKFRTKYELTTEEVDYLPEAFMECGRRYGFEKDMLSKGKVDDVLDYCRHSAKLEERYESGPESEFEDEEEESQYIYEVEGSRRAGGEDWTEPADQTAYPHTVENLIDGESERDDWLAEPALEDGVEHRYDPDAQLEDWVGQAYEPDESDEVEDWIDCEPALEGRHKRDGVMGKYVREQWWNAKEDRVIEDWKSRTIDDAK